MKHKCKITVLKRECYQDLQGKYLADPKSGPCPFFREGQEIIVDSDNYFRMLHGTFCAEAWDCSAVMFTPLCKAARLCAAGRMTRR